MPGLTGQPLYCLMAEGGGHLYSSKGTGLSKAGRVQKKNSPMTGQEHLETEDCFSPPETQVKACSVSVTCPHLARSELRVEEVKLLSRPSSIPPRKVWVGSSGSGGTAALLWKRSNHQTGVYLSETRPPLVVGPGMPSQVGVSAPVGNTNCLQWRAESSGSFFLFLSPDSQPSKQYSRDASALKRILRDSPSS